MPVQERLLFGDRQKNRSRRPRSIRWGTAGSNGHHGHRSRLEVSGWNACTANARHHIKSLAGYARDVVIEDLRGEGEWVWWWYERKENERAVAAVVYIYFQKFCKVECRSDPAQRNMSAMDGGSICHWRMAAVGDAGRRHESSDLHRKMAVSSW